MYERVFIAAIVTQ